MFGQILSSSNQKAGLVCEGRNSYGDRNHNTRIEHVSRYYRHNEGNARLFDYS